MSALAPFDYAGWVKGLTLDFSAWDGQPIKILKGKPLKKKREIKPAIHVLTSEFDNVGRSISDHRGMVDHYAALYDAGKNFFTGETETNLDNSEQRGVQKAREDEPWRDVRRSANTDAEGLELLKVAFKAIHDQTA